MSSDFERAGSLEARACTQGSLPFTETESSQPAKDMERICSGESQHPTTENHDMRIIWPLSLRCIVDSDPKAPRPVPRIPSPEKLTREKCKVFLKHFVVYIQLSAEKNGLDRPISMNDFMEALVKHPDFVESTLWFPGLPSDVDSAPTKWHEYPALHYLDLSSSAEPEDSPSGRSCSLSPTAKLFIPDRPDLPKRCKSSRRLGEDGKLPLGVAAQEASGGTELVTAQYRAPIMTRKVEQTSSLVPHTHRVPANDPSAHHQLLASQNSPSIASHQLAHVSNIAQQRSKFDSHSASAIVDQHPHPTFTQGASFQPGRKFEPSRMRQGLDRQITNEMKQLADRMGYTINPQYKGDVSKFTLRNVTCPDHLNVAVRIDGIDPNATVQLIMSKF
ncbi:hypothetical protein BDZ45DRAFT_738464 [Acephala macrosclerotiorum]|nr:hypothetical protein BDZ45DRAFT_738464 [Acephala macrosclerotiorum]